MPKRLLLAYCVLAACVLLIIGGMVQMVGWQIALVLLGVYSAVVAFVWAAAVVIREHC